MNLALMDKYIRETCSQDDIAWLERDAATRPGCALLFLMTKEGRDHVRELLRAYRASVEGQPASVTLKAK